jgi:hypothetical protein
MPRYWVDVTTSYYVEAQHPYEACDAAYEGRATPCGDDNYRVTDADTGTIVADGA